MTPTADPIVSNGSISFDASEFEPRSHFERHHYWHLHRRRVVARELAKLQPGQDKLLDLGCGVGTVANYLATKGFTVDCADGHAEALKWVERDAAQVSATGPKRRFFVHDLNQPLPTREYRGILLLDVLEHLANDRQALSNALAGLRREADSFVVVTVPASQELFGEWDRSQGHYRRYSQAELRFLLRSQGLRVTRMTGFFLPLRPALVATKAVRRIQRTILGEPQRQGLDQWVETRTDGVASSAAKALLNLEYRLLGQRDLRGGTSLLAVAHWA